VLQVADAAALANTPELNEALADGIAAGLDGVDSSMVEIMSVTVSRRLGHSRLLAAQQVSVDYRIVIPVTAASPIVTTVTSKQIVEAAMSMQKGINEALPEGITITGVVPAEPDIQKNAQVTILAPAPTTSTTTSTNSADQATTTSSTTGSTVPMIKMNVTATVIVGSLVLEVADAESLAGTPQIETILATGIATGLDGVDPTMVEVTSVTATRRLVEGRRLPVPQIVRVSYKIIIPTSMSLANHLIYLFVATVTPEEIVKSAADMQKGINAALPDGITITGMSAEAPVIHKKVLVEVFAPQPPPTTTTTLDFGQGVVFDSNQKGLAPRLVVAALCCFPYLFCN